MRIVLILSFMTCLLTCSQAQRSDKVSRYFGEAIWTDSTSTIFFPIRYNEELFSTNKLAVWGGYYANIVVYNFQQDTYRNLFPSDTFIAFYGSPSLDTHWRAENKNITRKWVFMLVKHRDYNESGRVDEKDPSMLFASTIKGDSLKQLTASSENVVSFKIYEKQGFALIRVQRDSDGDGYFKEADKVYYLRKISLQNLSLGKPIEIK